VCVRVCTCVCCREVRAEKERLRIIRTGRNKFNTKPKDVSGFSVVHMGKQVASNGVSQVRFSLYTIILRRQEIQGMQDGRSSAV